MIDQRVAVLGLGKIGTILLRGLLKAGLSPSNACATVRHADRTRALGGKLTLAVGTDNRAAARSADIILISVKPQNVGELLDEIRADVTPAKLVVSAAASVPTSYIEGDRKSTRLNSSHGYISYAVFCLKKKKKKSRVPVRRPILPRSRMHNSHA